MSTSSASCRFRGVASWVLTSLLGCAAGFGQNISQFDVYWATEGIALGPDGAMWFTDPQSNQIGRIDGNGSVTTFDLPGANRFPEGIVRGSDGNLWFTEIGPPGRIGRITTSGAVTEFELPGVDPRPYGIASAPDGNLWFTEQRANQIGRMTISGVLTEFPVPTASAGLAGISPGPDGNLWFAERTGNKIGRITTSGTVTEFDLPTANSHPTAVATGPDGNVWFTESIAPRVGRISPSGDIAEFPVSGGSVGVAAGHDGHLWFTGYGVLRRLAPSGAGTELSVPLYGPSDLGIALAPDGAFWMSDNINGFGAQIVRVALDTSPCVADATTLCLNQGRFRVTANWQTHDGSTGQGRGVALTPNSGYFWFFDAASVELVVKVLDGCSFSETHWFFAGGLTDVEVRTIVTDTQTGRSKTYTNPLGTPFAPIQDTSTFPTCSRASAIGLWSRR